MDRLEQARALRANVEVHHNCCQSVLLPFASELGRSREELFALGAHFGAGMRHGSACGALSGALMALGMLGYGEEEALKLLEDFSRRHGSTECRTLSAPFLASGGDRKPMCDGLVYEMVSAVEALLPPSREG